MPLPKIALQRGYRAGNSDGYLAGYRDVSQNLSRNIQRHKEYLKADRAFTQDIGALEDYRDGYQQGFETGYATGFEKRSFNSVLPADLKSRGATAPYTSTSTTSSVKPKLAPKASNAGSQSSGEPIILIPSNVELTVELLGDLNTDTNKEGDKFQARIITPVEIAGSIVEGRIMKIQKPGRIKRRSEMTLSFDVIRLSETRWSNFNAVLTEVLPVKGNNVQKVDVEGTVEGKGSLKTDAMQVGAATGVGAGVGLVVAGPVGAAVGAGVGAAFGVGAVVVERGKDVRLSRGQQLKIKTVYETQIR